MKRGNAIGELVEKHHLELAADISLQLTQLKSVQGEHDPALMLQAADRLSQKLELYYAAGLALINEAQDVDELLEELS